MGLEFKTENERNAIQGPNGPTLPKVNCEEELALMTQFLEDNGYIMLYDHYKVMLAEKAKVEELYKNNDGFEEVN